MAGFQIFSVAVQHGESNGVEDVAKTHGDQMTEEVSRDMEEDVGGGIVSGAEGKKMTTCDAVPADDIDENFHHDDEW